MVSNFYIVSVLINTNFVKPTPQDIKLDLNKVLEKVWNQGLPNGISNGL